MIELCCKILRLYISIGKVNIFLLGVCLVFTFDVNSVVHSEACKSFDYDHKLDLINYRTVCSLACVLNESSWIMFLDSLKCCLIIIGKLLFTAR